MGFFYSLFQLYLFTSKRFIWDCECFLDSGFFQGNVDLFFDGVDIL